VRGGREGEKVAGGVQRGQDTPGSLGDWAGGRGGSEGGWGGRRRCRGVGGDVVDRRGEKWMVGVRGGGGEWGKDVGRRGRRMMREWSEGVVE